MIKRLESVEDMSDIPIRNMETFRDAAVEPPSATLMSPSQSKIADIDVDEFFQQDDFNLTEVDSMMALTILNYLIRLLVIRCQDECESPVDALSDLPSPPLGPEEIDDCPLSPRKTNSRSSDSQGETQFLENTPDVNESNKNPTSKIMQNKILAKRFSLKSNPPVTVEEYLERINQYCGLSTAVYLTTSLYLFKLVRRNEVLKLNDLNIHRILIAALRISCKTVEDMNHRQTFIAKIGGVNNKDLLSLEISFLFLLKFECQANETILTTFLRDMKILHQESK